MARPADGPPAARPAGVPWREILLAASVLFLGVAVALLAFILPLAAFLAVFDERPRRWLAGMVAVAVAASVALDPTGRFFAAASVLGVAATILLVFRSRRVGYAETSLTVLAGLAAAVLLWIAIEPGYFGTLRSGLDRELSAVTREAIASATGRSRLDPDQVAAVKDVFLLFAGWVARLWPAGVFAVSWLGVGVSLELAARAARGRLRERVPIGEPFTAFRLPEIWIWVLIVGSAGFLATRAGSLAHDAALNTALIAVGVYACQGLAVVVYYLRRRGVGPVRGGIWLALGLVILPIPLLIMALGVGLADVWLDLRQRLGETPPTPDV